jgi:hypothetical protein
LQLVLSTILHQFSVGIRWRLLHVRLPVLQCMHEYAFCMQSCTHDHAINIDLTYATVTAISSAPRACSLHSATPANPWIPCQSFASPACIHNDFTLPAVSTVIPESVNHVCQCLQNTRFTKRNTVMNLKHTVRMYAHATA